MFIFEWLYEAFKNPKLKLKNYNPLDEATKTQEEEEEDCNHCFLPLDSTGELFACKYCGKIVKKSELKDVNIFKN